MKTQTRRNLEKLKQDTVELFSKLKMEIPLALLLGTAPMLLFCSTEKDVEEMLSGLLAIGPLIKYSVILTFPYFLVLLVKHGIRFSFDSSRAKFDYVHDLITEVGPGFLTITRTALGAIIGILIILNATHIITGTPKQIAAMYLNAVFFLAFNCALAMGKDRAAAHANRQLKKNPIQLSRKIR